jgi:hypothetical protein
LPIAAHALFNFCTLHHFPSAPLFAPLVLLIGHKAKQARNGWRKQESGAGVSADRAGRRAQGESRLRKASFTGQPKLVSLNSSGQQNTGKVEGRWCSLRQQQGRLLYVSLLGK